MDPVDELGADVAREEEEGDDVQAEVLQGTNSIEKFWLQFRLEKSLEFRLEISLH